MRGRQGGASLASPPRFRCHVTGLSGLPLLWFVQFMDELVSQGGENQMKARFFWEVSRLFCDLPEELLRVYLCEVCHDVCLDRPGIWVGPKFDEFRDVDRNVGETSCLHDLPVRLVS